MVWFRVLKSQYNQRWANWFRTTEHTFTAAGNRRGPSYETVLEWISEIWSDLNPNLIIKSFDKCGITSSSELHQVLNQMVHQDIVTNEVVEERDMNERLGNMWLEPENDAEDMNE